MMLTITDTVSRAKRSEIMRAIRSRGNKATELVLVRLLRENRILGWRRNVALAGSPDFAFLEIKLALFVDGCFGHGCPQHCRMPKANRAYWNAKIASNNARDRRVSRLLRTDGWRVLRIWEHELARRNVARLLRKIRSALASE